MTRTYLTIMLCNLLLITGCSKEKLTKATQKGANTMSCKINGKVHVAQSSWGNEAVFASLYTDNTFIAGGHMYKNNKYVTNIYLTLNPLLDQVNMNFQNLIIMGKSQVHQ